MANRIKGITVEIGGDTTEQLQNGEISQEQYDALQREIAETEVFHNSRCHTINRYSVQDCVVWEVLLYAEEKVVFDLFDISERG